MKKTLTQDEVQTLRDLITDEYPHIYPEISDEELSKKWLEMDTYHGAPYSLEMKLDMIYDFLLAQQKCEVQE